MNSCSKRNRFLVFSTLLLAVSALILYYLQHTHRLSGGAIAPAKLAWLFTVVVYWYITPVYWLMDETVSAPCKVACSLFLASMVARGLIELYMMYVSNNWLHRYGISHDVLSIVLCLFAARAVFRTEFIISMYFLFCAGLFAIEIVFASYLAKISGADGTVFFVENASEHSSILWMTRVAVVLSALAFYFIIKEPARATT